MTFIVGITLSDRIYLAADTRVTVRGSKGVRVHDNCLKIESLAPRIMIAVAGDVGFAQYLIGRLRRSVVVASDDGDILLAHLNDAIGPIVDDYLVGHDFPKSAFLIASSCPNRPKKLPHAAVVEMAYRRLALDEDRKRRRLEQFESPSDPGFHEAFSEEISRPNVGASNLFRALRSGVDSEGEVTLQSRDNLLIGVELTPPAAPVVHVGRWGQFLSFGSGRLEEGDIPDDFFPGMEFALADEVTTSRTQLSAFISSVADRSPSVGGGITVGFATDQLCVMVGGGVDRVGADGVREFVSEISGDSPNGLRGRSADGTWYPLVPVSRWSMDDGASADLSLMHLAGFPGRDGAGLDDPGGRCARRSGGIRIASSHSVGRHPRDDGRG